MRILILRTSALGDIVHALPVLTALRSSFPEAKIGWVVERSMAPLLEGHPDIDDLLVVALRHWRKEPLSPQTRSEFGAFRAELKRFSADVALDLMGNHKGALLARMSGAPRRIGLRKAERREPSSALWINEPVSCDAPHAVDRGLAIAAALGAETAAVDFAGERLREVIPRSLPQEPFILLFPATGWQNKNYPPASLGEVARGVAEESGLPVYVNPGPGEEAIAAEVVRTAAGAARMLPVVPIPELVALVRRARLAIGGDTGPIHLARAVGTPTLCVMGPTDPTRNGPYRAPEQVVVEPLPCSFCYKRYDEAKPCLLSIPPKRLEERALALLQGS